MADARAILKILTLSNTLGCLLSNEGRDCLLCGQGGPTVQCGQIGRVAVQAGNPPSNWKWSQKESTFAQMREHVRAPP